MRKLFLFLICSALLITMGCSGMHKPRSTMVDTSQYTASEISKMRNQGFACALKDRMECAIEKFEAILSKNPKDKSNIYNLAMAYKLKGEYLKAIEVLTPLKSNQSIAQRAQIYYELNQDLIALQEINRAINQDPFNGEYWLIRFQIQMMMKNTKSAYQSLLTSCIIGNKIACLAATELKLLSNHNQNKNSKSKKFKYQI